MNKSCPTRYSKEPASEHFFPQNLGGEASPEQINVRVALLENK